MTKRFLATLIVICLLLSMLPLNIPAYATAKESQITENCHTMTKLWFADKSTGQKVCSKKNADKLQNTLSAYFAVREDMCSGAPIAKRALSSQSAIVSTEAKTRSSCIRAFQERAQIDITDAEVTFFCDNDHILYNNDGTVTLFVYEWTFFDYDDLHDNISATDVSGFGVYHKITLKESVNNSYHILTDEYDESDMLGLCTMNSSTKEELLSMDYTPIDIDSPIIESLQSETEIANAEPAKRGTYYSSYNPDAAANYADRYVYHGAQGGAVYEGYYNSAYHNFNSVGGDCANYTSQCIYAGGMPQVVCAAYGTDGWYYKSSSDRSATWASTTNLRNWMANNRGTKVTASSSTVYKGSPVFYNDAHTTICVGKNSAGTPIINSHNKDYYHTVWNYWGSGTTYTTVQLTGGSSPSRPVDGPVLVDYNYPTHIDSGKAFSIYGRIYSCKPLEWVNVWVADMDNNTMQSWNSGSQMSECNIASTADNYVHFGQLPDGTYHYCVEATDTNHTYRMLLDVIFTVGNVAAPSNRIGVYKTTKSCAIHSGAGMMHSSIGTVPKDALLNITEINETWGKVSYNGVTGYVSLYYCTLITPFTDIGSDFYAYIVHSDPWNHLENANGNVQIAAGGNDSWDPRQIWKFNRCSDGSYTVINCYDNSYLDNYHSQYTNGNNIISWPDPSGAANQQWLLTDGGFIVSKGENGMVLDVTENSSSRGTNIELFKLHTGASQKFTIYVLTRDGVQYAKPAKPDAPVVTVSSPVAVNTDTTIKWSTSNLKSKFDKRSYSVKIWKPDGSLFLNKSNVAGTSLTVKYPTTGKYTVQVIAVNDKYANYYTESQKATVTVQPAHTHKYTYKVTTAPTTGAAGKLTGTCSCGATTMVTLPKLDTTNYNYSVIKAPTCTTTGTGRYTWKTTTYGNFYFDVAIAKTAHSYRYDKITAYPSTGSTGTLVGTCSCGATTSITLPKLDTTNYNYSVIKAPTCTTTGTGRYTWKVTTYGNFYFDASIAKTAHDYKPTVTAPTCTAQGYTTHTCSVCGDSYKDAYTNALGHSWNSGVITKAATCTTDGVKTYTCTRCNATKTETIAMLGHSYGSWVTDKAATCSAAGTETRTCSRCQNKETRTVAALGHAESEWIIDRDATCTASGSKHTECTRCGITMQTERIAATGHKESEWIIDRNATCTAAGSKHTECITCGATLQTTAIAALGHDYKSTVTAPTCTAQGFTTHTCTRCNDTYKDTHTDALGHAWDNGKVTTEPTETAPGVKTFTCTRCGATRTESIPALSHTHHYTATVTPPTCTEKGYTTHTCACGDSYVDSYVDALGHDFGEWVVTKEATEDEAGEETRTCARCGEVETRETAKLDCASEKFVDVNSKAWYHKAIDFALANGIFSGADDTHFNPNGKTTRAMFVAVLWRLDGREESSAANPFADAKAGSYYEKAVIWAAANKIVAGTDAVHFNPNGNVTREQVAAFLYRYASAKDYDLSASADLSKFPDASKISNYAKDNLAWAVGAGLISGSKDAASGTVYLDPKGNATRAQVAQILMMFTQKIAK